MCSTDKPLAPQNVIVNITKEGYYITWTHTAVPGRPEVEKFVVEYREGNDSSTWLVATAAVPESRRVYLFEAEMIEEDKTYDFRVFAFGANEFSEAAYVSKIYKLGEFGFCSAVIHLSLYVRNHFFTEIFAFLRLCILLGVSLIHPVSQPTNRFSCSRFRFSCYRSAF